MLTILCLGIVALSIGILVYSLIIMFHRKEKYKDNWKEHEKDNDYLTLCDKNLAYHHPKILKKFISPEICDQLIALAKKKGFVKSMVANNSNDVRSRKSHQSWLPKDDNLVHPIYKRVEKMTRVPIKNYEDMQIVEYTSTDYFKEHYDQCFLRDDYCKGELERFSHPRFITVLIYLNDKHEYEGGETLFPTLNLRFKENKGDAILFYNLDASKRYVHPKAYHSGTEIKNGLKYIGNIWVRDS